MKDPQPIAGASESDTAETPKRVPDLPKERSRAPGRWASVWMLARWDAVAMSGSWLVRGFAIVTGLLTVLTLKGMQAEQQAASRMLEAVCTSYIGIWMHGVVFIAGGALAREQDCLSDAILSRGITRGEYLGGKLLARCLVIGTLIGGVLLPAGFWAIRQDGLIRTETGAISAKTENTRVEAWDPHKIFAEIDGPILEMNLEKGDAVRAGDVLALIDDRKLFDDLEMLRRAEEDARQEVEDARRRAENGRRTAAQSEEALSRAERALLAKDLLSQLEQADRAADLRMRKRDVKNAENDLRMLLDGVAKAQRSVETAQARVLESRKRLSQATVTAPVSGYVTELLVEPSQYAAVGSHLFTIAPLDEFQLRVPVYNFDEFKRLKAGLEAYITIESTEYTGTIDRLGAMTEKDRWGRDSNYAIVRFQGDGTLGMLGMNADVRLVLPPPEIKPNRATALLNAVTGRGEDDLASRTASVTPFWMLIALGKVVGCAMMLVTLTLLLAALSRNALIAILGGIGLWHVSNVIFDFAGLPALSYLEMIRTMDKVLGGVVNPNDELITLIWMGAFTAVFSTGALALFITRDPPK